MGKKSKRRGDKKISKSTTAEDTQADLQGIDELVISNTNENPPSDAGLARTNDDDTSATKFVDTNTQFNEMKDIFDELFQSEISWLKSLPSEVQEELTKHYRGAIKQKFTEK